MPKAKLDLKEIADTEAARQQAKPCRLYCCASTGCVASGCKAVMSAVQGACEAHHIADKVEVVPTGCMGLCSLGPLVRVEIQDRKPVLYKEMNPLLARLVVAEHVKPGLDTPAGQDFAIPEFLAQYSLSLDLPFFTRQTKVVLANSGVVDPERIEDYIARGGYQALEKVLTAMTPEQVIEELRTSGLRGRGGAGFPTATKWTFARKTVGDEKFIICNGDEGDPGAYMDRSVLEGNPHAVLEGMLIAAYATGATEGWYYIRAEYPLAVERTQIALKQARKLGLLGQNILGTNFSFTADIRLGAGAFVCGEETALINSIEGLRGTPRPRPPYPSIKGLWGKPSCVNNVETLANIAPIIVRGGTWFASMGTATSKGTKVFALTGKVRHSGLIEVPMGMSLKTIVEEIGGGNPAGKAVKALQTGGPSGGVIPISLLDIPVCYEELRKLGSMMGSGGMIVMDEDDSMVEIARFYLGFTVDESCGKCAPCRIGGAQMLRLLDRICDGKGTLDDLDSLRRLALAMQRASLCGLGQTAPNPVISTMRYFEQEYMAKVQAFSGAHAEEWYPLDMVNS